MHLWQECFEAHKQGRSIKSLKKQSDGQQTFPSNNNGEGLLRVYYTFWVL